MSIKLFTSDKIPLYFKQSMFPVGENYVRLEKESFSYIGKDKEINIEWIFNGDGEFLQLALLVDSICQINKDIKINLVCPYFPGARQDRVCETGEAFNLKVYSNLINSLNFNKVRVFDPHSDVTGALVNNIEIMDNINFVRKSIETQLRYKDQIAYLNDHLITLISPDAGANKKIFKLAKQLPWKNIEVIRADKIRDTKTGEITDTEVYGDVSKKTIFIVDDIGSKCNTFIKLAEALKQKGAARIILILSHWEGGANNHDLKNSGIDKIYIHNNLGDVLDKNYLIEVK